MPKESRRLTQTQLLACLVMKAYQKQTYRGTVNLMAASDDLRRVLGLARRPSYSALQRFADRAGTPDLIDRVLGRLVARVRPAVEDVTMDATGVESSNASARYTARRGTRHKGYVKLSLVVICGCLLPLGLVVSRSPPPARHQRGRRTARPGERQGQAEAAVRGQGVRRRGVLEFCYRVWKVRSYIPAVVKR